MAHAGLWRGGLLAIVLFAGISASAQFPDKFTSAAKSKPFSGAFFSNLKVLPKDIPKHEMESTTKMPRKPRASC
jgi:hypothetical protein